MAGIAVAYSPAFSILAQESRSPTARFHTGRSAAESRTSTQKYPFRSN
jgi:hypothetical protein